MTRRKIVLKIIFDDFIIIVLRDLQFFRACLHLRIKKVKSDLIFTIYAMAGENDKLSYQVDILIVKWYLYEVRDPVQTF